MTSEDILLNKAQQAGVMLSKLKNKDSLFNYYDSQHGKHDAPKMNPIYAQSVEMAYDVSVHAEIDVFPEKIFKSKAPNESKEQYEYRRKAYVNNTNHVWNRCVTSVMRIWNKQNYKLEFNEDDAKYKNQTFQSYVTDDYPLLGSLLDFFQNVVTNTKLKDPNAILTIEPKNVPFDFAEEVTLLEDTTLIEPIANIYESKYVIDYIENEYALTLTKMTSFVQVGEKRKKEGLVFKGFDQNNIYLIYQVGKKEDQKYKQVVLYSHRLGKLPCQKLKGIPLNTSEDLKRMLYKSYFYGAVPLLNLATYYNSNLQLTTVSHIFLEKWEYVDECQSCNGSGHVFNDGQRGVCEPCHGTGYVSKRTEASAVHKIKSKGQVSDPDDAISPPPAGYIEKPIEIVKYLDEKISDLENKAYQTLNITTTNQVNGTETATGRAIDREEFYSFLIQFSNEVFGLLSFTLGCVGVMRYNQDFNGFELSAPSSFQLRTSQELVDELEKSKKVGASPVAIGKLNVDYVMNRYSTAANAVRSEKLRQRIDPLANLGKEQIQNGLNYGYYSKVRAVAHDVFSTFITMKLTENENYLETADETISSELLSYAENLVGEVQTPVTVDNILVNANS